MPTKLKAPEGCGAFVTSTGVEYKPDEDGLITVENEAHVSEMTHHHHGFVVAAHVAPPASKTGTGVTTEEDIFLGMTKDDLRDWLDERDVEYPNRSSKDDLLSLARNFKAPE